MAASKKGKAGVSSPKRSPEHGLTFIVPAYNEENAISSTLARLHKALMEQDLPFEIIVVNDGSTDQTRQRAEVCDGARVIDHPINTGYGSAIKSGVRVAKYDWVGIVDADGTYEIEKVGMLIDKMKNGFDMVIASRENVFDTDRPFKRLARRILLSFLGLWVSGKIKDPNSGFRIFKRDFVETFYPFLCDTFSFTTSSTIFAIGEGYFVTFIPMQYFKRTGKSKVRHLRDSLRMMQLILQGITFFNPLKFFILLILLLLFFVMVPAFLLTIIGYEVHGDFVATAGAWSILLLGLGVLGDIVRVAMTSHTDTKHAARKSQYAPPK